MNSPGPARQLSLEDHAKCTWELLEAPVTLVVIGAVCCLRACWIVRSRSGVCQRVRVVAGGGPLCVTGVRLRAGARGRR